MHWWARWVVRLRGACAFYGGERLMVSLAEERMGVGMALSDLEETP